MSVDGAASGETSPVRLSDAPAALEGYAAARGGDLDSLDAPGLVSVMTDWYADQRVAGVDLAADGDMLLFQWGTYDWGSGPTFEFDIARQLARGDEGVLAPEIWQLSVCLHYQPAADNAALGRGSRWCGHPDEVVDFVAFASAAQPTVQLAGLAPERVEIRFEGVD